MIDWIIAERIARYVAGTGDADGLVWGQGLGGNRQRAARPIDQGRPAHGAGYTRYLLVPAEEEERRNGAHAERARELGERGLLRIAYKHAANAEKSSFFGCFGDVLADFT